jgi:hypothetical protein
MAATSRSRGETLAVLVAPVNGGARLAAAAAARNPIDTPSVAALDTSAALSSAG